MQVIIQEFPVQIEKVCCFELLYIIIIYVKYLMASTNSGVFLSLSARYVFIQEVPLEKVEDATL